MATYNLAACDKIPTIAFVRTGIINDGFKFRYSVYIRTVILSS